MSRSQGFTQKFKLKTRLTLAFFAVLLTFSSVGCSLLDPAATTIQYSAGIGASVEIRGLLIRNFFIVADDERQGTVIMTVIVLHGNHSIKLRTDESEEVEVFLNEGVNFIYPKTNIKIGPLGAKPGEYADVIIMYKGSHKAVFVPILRSDFPDYKYIIQNETDSSHALGGGHSNQIQGIA